MKMKNQQQLVEQRQKKKKPGNENHPEFDLS